MKMFFKKCIRVTSKSIADFYRDGGLMLAGSISYFSMMAFIPFCLLLVAIFGYFLGEDRELLAFFSERLISYFPDTTSGITRELEKIISYKGLGSFSLILYCILSFELFSSMETAINIIFKTKAKRHFIASVFLSVIMITLIISLIVISFSAASTISVFQTYKKFFRLIEISGITRFAVSFILPLILMLFTVTALYILLPKKKIRLSHAFSGALFATTLFEAAKYLFTVYVMKLVHLGTIYGSLSAFVIFLLWLFYSSCIFLIGAEMVHNIGTTSRKQK